MSNEFIELSFDDKVLYISRHLDQKIFLPTYKSRSGQLEFSLSSIASLAKVSKKLQSIKVYCAILSVFFFLSALRYLLQGKLKGLIFLAMSFDFLLISYNSYDRNYASIVTRKTLNSTRELGASVVSLLSKSVGVVNENSKIDQLINEINWNYLLTGTISEFILAKV